MIVFDKHFAVSACRNMIDMQHSRCVIAVSSARPAARYDVRVLYKCRPTACFLLTQYRGVSFWGILFDALVLRHRRCG